MQNKRFGARLYMLYTICGLFRLLQSQHPYFLICFTVKNVFRACITSLLFIIGSSDTVQHNNFSNLTSEFKELNCVKLCGYIVTQVYIEQTCRIRNAIIYSHVFRKKFLFLSFFCNQAQGFLSLTFLNLLKLLWSYKEHLFPNVIVKGRGRGARNRGDRFVLNTILGEVTDTRILEFFKIVCTQR